MAEAKEKITDETEVNSTELAAVLGVQHGEPERARKGRVSFCVSFRLSAPWMGETIGQEKVTENIQKALKPSRFQGKKLELLPGFGPGTSSLPIAV